MCGCLLVIAHSRTKTFMVWHKMTLKLLLLVCIVFNQIEHNLIDTKTIKIIPSGRILKEVGTIQAFKCINNGIDSEHLTSNGTNTVFYQISCKKAKSITVNFKIAKAIGTSKEMTQDIPTDCREKISKFNATVLSVNEVEVFFSSEEPAKYIINCRNEEDRAVAYNRVHFVYRPQIETVHIERDVFDNINISVIRRNYEKNQIQEYWTISCYHFSSYRSLRNSQWKPCNITSKNELWAKLHGDPEYSYSFNITARGLLGIYTKLYNYSFIKIPVRLPAFENITKTVTENSIHLSLNLLSIVHVYSLEKQYQVIYRSERDPQDLWKTKRMFSNKILLENLHPFTKYIILASAREKHSTIWNKNVTLIIKTKAAAPSSPPTTTDGNYFDLTCSNINKTCLSVFWQSLPMESRNDILTGYCVQYINGSSSTKNTEQCLDSNNLIVDSLYKDFRDLPRNQTLTFSIMAVTKSRRMSQPTFIQVKTTAPKKPTAVYVMRINDKMYNVSWLIEQPQETVNVTVFWCQNKMTSSKVECRDHVKWKTLVNESYLLVNYSGEERPVFAAYVSTKKGSSSLTQAECIFTPGKPTKPSVPHISWSETKFSLTWPTLYCSNWNGIPVAYLLHYAEGKNCENDKKKEFPVNGTKTVENIVDINGLESDTEYSVCIQVKTKDGISLMSDTTTGMTKDTGVIVLVVIILLPVLFVLIMVVAFIKYCCSRCTKIKKDLKVEYVNKGSGIGSTSNHYDEINRDNYEYEPLQGESTAIENLVVEIPSTEAVTTGYESLENSSANSLQTNTTTHSASRLLVNEPQDNATNSIEESYSLSEFSSVSVPTCVNSNMKEIVSCGTDYVDDQNSSLIEIPPVSETTCVNGNLKEIVSNRTDYVDEPNGSFSELPSVSVPTSMNDNFMENVSSRTDYVDEPSGLTKLVSNSIPPCKTMNSKGSIPDYIFSVPETSEESTNSYKSKPLKGQILQTENKENNQIETSKINGRTDEENVKVNFTNGYVPHEHIVKVTESSLDEVKNKKMDKFQQKDTDYVKTEML